MGRTGRRRISFMVLKIAKVLEAGPPIYKIILGSYHLES